VHFRGFGSASSPGHSLISRETCSLPPGYNRQVFLSDFLSIYSIIPVQMSTVPTANLLLSNVEYEVIETRRGTWRRYLYPTGQLFEEFVSHAHMFGMPVLHFTRGKCPETGKRIVAKGVIAIGRMALGILAIGQASCGLIAIGQLAIGVLFGMGQLCTGVFALGQFAVGTAFAVGQFAGGYAAIGQIAYGKYVLAQIGFGDYVWDMRGASDDAVKFFQAFVS
jgi:hypothetical protein